MPPSSMKHNILPRSAPSPQQPPPRYKALWYRQILHSPRWSRCIAAAIIATFALVGMFKGLSARYDQQVKQYATNFSSLHGRPLWVPQHPVRHMIDATIDNRYAFLRALGHGQEGYTALYTDLESGHTVVVKTFTSPARNGLPAELVEAFADYTSTWPSEIEAGLLLGNNASDSVFLNVNDYFILETDNSWVWSLVSPFITGGTLKRLARHEEESRFASPDELHQLYRSTFATFLSSLAPLHNAGICHDDVKPDNIFISAPDRWLLGDLGNLRHVSHPWHGTRSWLRQNQWTDCRLNDIRRALKTYLWFLRSASANTADFDRQFWEGKTDWSQLYWNFLHSVRAKRRVTVEGLSRIISGDDHGGATIEKVTASRSQPSLASLTERELTCTSIPWHLWNWQWWFGFS